MSIQPLSMRRNRILECLSDIDFNLLEPNLQNVELGFRKCLQSSNRRIETVYFPDSGLGSVVASGRGREAQAEVGVFGREGMSGLALVHGSDRSPFEIFMQVEGQGRQIASADLQHAMAQSTTMRDCFFLYAHAFAIQSGYTALANAKGTLEQRLARWLLMAQDRLDGPQIVLTHEFLALMLGVRRAGVSTALQQLQHLGLTQSDRGAVTIIDRDGLQEVANGLYGPPEAEYERHFPAVDCRR